MTHMEKEIFAQPSVLGGIESANAQTLRGLTEELVRRGVRHVHISGRGTSSHAGIYAQYLLAVYKGVTVSMTGPSCITLYDGQLDMAGDLVIGISQSGQAADVLAVMEQGKKQGAVTLAVTNEPDSPMAKAADYHLYCNAGKELSVAATKTFTSQMFALGLLVAYWSGNDALLAALRGIPARCEEFLTDTSPLDAHVSRYRYIREGFVLARGFSYPIALESALKIQETCYIKMKGYAVSDFYHGPLAQVDPDVPVMLLAVKGAAMADARAMLEKLNEIGAQPLVVTDDAALAGECTRSVLIPDAGFEAVAPFLLALFAQTFACKLSGQKGLDPDQPRLLKKVTITK